MVSSVQSTNVNPPPYNEVVTGTVTFEGLAHDATGVQGYSLSFDGGQTWEVAEPASVNGLFIAYEHEWDSTTVDGYDATTIPVLIRATDWLNLSTVVPLSITVDSGEPSFYTDVTFSSPVGTHLDQGEAEASLTIEWSTPFDGSGTAVPVFGTNFDGENSSSSQFPEPTVQMTEPVSYTHLTLPTILLV